MAPSGSSSLLRPSKASIKSSNVDPRSGYQMSIADIGRLIKDGDIKNVVVMAGAGISTAAGIPDFRSPETGLYANLEKYKLPYPEAIFDIDYFVKHPEAFYTLASELFPGKFNPTLTHHFLRLLELKGILTRCFTQNIDTLERLAHVSEELIIEAHGSFAEAHCLNCGRGMGMAELRTLLVDAKPVRCKQEFCLNKPKARQNLYVEADNTLLYIQTVSGLRDYGYHIQVIKPDIVFFGEGLPKRFFAHLSDLQQADLLIVLGTSLQVQPFASLVTNVSKSCLRLLINLERVGDQMFDFEKPGGRDVLYLGETDSGVQKLCEIIGWLDELQGLSKSANTQEDLPRAPHSDPSGQEDNEDGETCPARRKMEPNMESIDDVKQQTPEQTNLDMVPLCTEDHVAPLAKPEISQDADKIDLVDQLSQGVQGLSMDRPGHVKHQDKGKIIKEKSCVTP